jgi:hypothetical protein
MHLVSFWTFGGSLISWLELQDLDLDDDNRSLLHYGHLTRKRKCRCGFNGWSDLFVALLDNYCMYSSRLVSSHRELTLISSRHDQTSNWPDRRLGA